MKGGMERLAATPYGASAGVVQLPTIAHSPDNRARGNQLSPPDRRNESESTVSAAAQWAALSMDKPILCRSTSFARLCAVFKWPAAERGVNPFANCEMRERPNSPAMSSLEAGVESGDSESLSSVVLAGDGDALPSFRYSPALVATARQ